MLQMQETHLKQTEGKPLVFIMSTVCYVATVRIVLLKWFSLMSCNGTNK
jgi:hypothetical protein